MQVVHQPLKSSGCGIATVACLTGISYEESLRLAKEVLWPEETRKRFYTTSNDLRKLLKVLGVKTSPKKVTTSWDEVSNLAIAAIRLHRNGNWHWVTFERDADGARVYDSNPQAFFGMPRTDFGRMKLEWYIPVIRS